MEGKIVSGARNIKVGQKIRIKLINLDPYRGFVDFAMVRNLESVSKN